GAGSAGCVLANRLSEDPSVRVLLLEAGPRDTDPWIRIPLGYGKLFKKPAVNWSYQSEPEPELNGRRIFTPRGKVLGGSSSINGLVYTRGQPEDFDDWETPGWSFGELLPYFKRSQDQGGKGLRGDALHGRGGPLAVSDQSEPHELCDAFIEAAVQAGHPRNPDFNGAQQEGAGYQQLTTRNGFRCSTAVGYLHPVAHRPNLKVETDALASRILISDRKAVAVQYLKGEKQYEAKANREILLCGGAINSPQLLQLSGVGPAALLREHGIALVLDQPDVGEHMQDHFQARIVLKCTRAITVNDDMQSLWRQAGMALRFAFLRKGPLSISAGYAGGFWRTRLELKRPDVQTHFLTFSLDRMGEKLHAFSGFTASICQLRPSSRGSVRIRSADPREAPAIRYNYLSTEHDRRTMIDGMRVLRRILEQPAIRPYIASEHVPGAKVQSDDEWLAYMRETGSTIYHPTCTAKMGTGPGAVVDSHLRLIGLAGLRVVDASVMPAVVSGNTNAAVIAIAEKAADLIRSQARRSSQ
ncbi:MAG: GMC family oxidoreductase, partial [Burkholderiales bacterium]